MSKEPYDVIDLKALRCFWAVAKNRSITRASIDLGITESAVSQRVKSLESYLGIKLYESRGGRVRLTAAGDRTFEQATATFSELESFEQDVAHADGAVDITICTYDPVMRYWLADVVEELARAHPLTRLRLLSRSGQECARLVRSNEADLAIVATDDVPDVLDMESLATFPGYVILPKGHPLASRGTEAFWLRLDEKSCAVTR
jgi:DNA-binding transcriptional LysR family regulator